jgi:hypothetical protein
LGNVVFNAANPRNDVVRAFTADVKDGGSEGSAATEWVTTERKHGVVVEL